VSPLAALAKRRALHIARRDAARPCCFGRCTTADQRARAAARPVERIPNLRIPHQRTSEEDRL
jgi:hypothetical protein